MQLSLRKCQIAMKGSSAQIGASGSGRIDMRADFFGLPAVPPAPLSARSAFQRYSLPRIVISVAFVRSESYTTVERAFVARVVQRSQALFQTFGLGVIIRSANLLQNQFGPAFNNVSQNVAAQLAVLAWNPAGLPQPGKQTAWLVVKGTTGGFAAIAINPDGQLHCDTIPGVAIVGSLNDIGMLPRSIHVFAHEIGHRLGLDHCPSAAQAQKGLPAFCVGNLMAPGGTGLKLDPSQITAMITDCHVTPANDSWILN